jgi:hypothetical protein
VSKTLVLLWLGTEAARASLEPDLAAWERAHWQKLVDPPADAPVGPSYDDRAAARAEELLEQARLATGSLDQATAELRLSELGKLLREHPELPQAAYLEAEALLVEAQLRAAADPSRAAELVSRARALEGPRAPAYGASAIEPAPAKVVRVSLVGLGASDHVEWDGEDLGRSFDALAGEHHVRVVRRERVVWAGWVELREGQGALTLPAPAAVPCSLDDLAGTRLSGARVSAPAGVRCPEWAVARATTNGVEVARCRGSSCGVLSRWKRGDGEFYSGPPQPPPEPGWPAWATWTLIGLGTAATTGVVLWRTGAFDAPERGRTRWTFTGPGQ